MANDLFDNGYALLIGTGGDLPATVQDARAVYDILVDPARAGYPTGQVTLLTEAEAGKAPVEQAFDRLIAQLAADRKPNATVLVYFSGHGGYDRDDPAHPFYLLTNGYDTGDLAVSSLRGDTFSGLLDRIGQHAKKLIVLLDSCHAGAVTTKDGTPRVEEATVKGAGRQRLRADMEQLVHALDRGSGRVIIASSGSDQLSLVDREAGLSVFTRYLVEALEGKNTPSKHTHVSFADLWEHIGLEVPRRSRALGREQTPILNVQDGTFFYLCKRAGGLPPRPRLYLDYADEDFQPFVEPFITQLDYLRDGGVIEGYWHRGLIPFGNVYQQIDEQLRNCHVLVELRGPGYLNYRNRDREERQDSQYPHIPLDTAIQRKMPRIPVILRNHLFKFDPTVKDYHLKVFPQENGQVKAVANWDSPDNAYYEVLEKIADIVASINA